MNMRQSFGFPLAVAVGTDVGRIRDNNEDSYGSAWLDDGSLFVMVADGMGGHEAGEVASNLAVQAVEDAITREPDGDPRTRMFDALLEANSAILDEGARSGTRGMGTTAIIAVLKGNQCFVGQVGDSRAYLVRSGKTIFRTNDHTRVQMLVDEGRLAAEEARNHPEAGMLTRALGHARMADGRPLVPDILAEPLVLEPDDAVVLSSDGLHDLVEDWEIAEIVAGKAPSEAVQDLIELACDRGGHDNITIAIITAGRSAAPRDPGFAGGFIEPVYMDGHEEADETYDGTGAYDDLPEAPERSAADDAIAMTIPPIAAAQPAPPPAASPVDIGAPAPTGPVVSADEEQANNTMLYVGIGVAVVVVLLLLLVIVVGGVAAAVFLAA